MTKFKSVTPYKFKRNLRKLVFGGAAAALLFAGCEKENNNPTNNTITHKFEYNKNMKFRRVGATDYMSYDVFKNDTLPALIKDKNNTFIFDVAECSQFLPISSMESRAEMIEALHSQAPTRVHAGNIPVEIREATYTNNVKRAFEEKLGASIIVR